jgi:hypothetical protein
LSSLVANDPTKEYKNLKLKGTVICLNETAINFENTNQKFQQNIRILAKDTTLSAYFDL